jgi:hypothetical protein
MQFTAVRIAAKIVGLVIVIYFVSFMWCFDLFSSPVRNKHGWLGPLIRGERWLSSVSLGLCAPHSS